MRETWGVSQEDSREARPVSKHIEEWAERSMRNIAETYVTKVDSNASLQESDPEHYGPYLEEGESYQTPRTAENVEKACKEGRGHLANLTSCQVGILSSRFQRGTARGTHNVFDDEESFGSGSCFRFSFLSCPCSMTRIGG